MALGKSKGPDAKVTIYVDDRPAERGRKQAEAKWKAWGRSISKGVGGAVGKVGGFAKSAFNPLGMGLSMMGDAVDETRQYERGIARLAIAQGKSNEEMAGFRSELTGISKETGINRNEILEGVAAYQALTGDTAGAAAASNTFARAAQATGSTVADVARAAAGLKDNFNIDPSQFEAAFDILNTQGKAGSIEMNGLAGIVAGLASQFKGFGGSGLKGMQQMGAGLQVIAKNFGGDVSKSEVGMRTLMSSIVGNGKKLERGGAKVFWKDKAGKKHLRDFGSIIKSIGESKLMKDPAKLKDAFGSSEALRAFQSLNDNKALFAQLATDQGGAGSIAKDLKQWQESDAGKLEASINNIKLALASAFSPDMIKGFAEALGSVAGAVNTIIGGVKGVAKAIGEDIFGKSWEQQKQDTNQNRNYERIGKNARAGKLGTVTKEELALIDALAAGKSGTDLFQYIKGVDQDQFAQVMRRGTQTNAQENAARELAYSDTPLAANDAFAAARTVAGGSDATSGNVRRSVDAARAAFAATPSDKLDPALAGAAAVFKAQADAARLMAQHLAAEMRKLTIDVKLDGAAVGKGVANSGKDRKS